MRATLIQFVRDNLKIIWTAIFGGMFFALFANGYWLVDIFPINSRRLLVATIFAGLAGLTGYFILLRWGRTQLQSIPTRQVCGLLGGSLLVGIFLLFAGTSQWQSPSRYISFFLPSPTLKISVIENEPKQISLDWFTTSLGDVSFHAFTKNGWEVRGDQVLLLTPNSNQLIWKGRVGEQALILFTTSSPAKILFTWDGEDEIVEISPEKFAYRHAFKIPFYASYAFIALLGILHFSFFAFIVLLLLWRAKKWPDWLRYSVKRFDKQHNAEYIILLGVLLLAFLLRFPNLGNTFPVVDEYYHLNAARQIIEGVPQNEVYQRSFWLVTYPISLVFKLFGYQIGPARLVGVIVNILALIPLYLFAKRINRSVGILSVLLYATSPWIITFARVVREYAYQPFFFYWIVLGLAILIEKTPDHFIWTRDWKKIVRVDIGLIGLGLMLPLLYMQFDSLATSQIITLAYVVFGIFILWKIEYSKENIVFLIFLGSILTLAYFGVGRQLFDNFHWKYNLGPINYFFPTSPLQWYYKHFLMIPALGFLAAIYGSIYTRRENAVPLFVLALFTIFLSVFLFLDFTGRTLYRARFFQATELWFIILLSFGLYLLWTFLVEFLGRFYAIPIAILLGFSFFNIRQSLLPATFTGGIYTIAPNDIYFQDVGKVHSYLMQHASSEDVLVSSLYHQYVAWQREPEFKTVYFFNLDTTENDIFSIVNQNDTGWVVLSQVWIEDMAFDPLAEFAKNDTIEFVGFFGDQLLWHWNTNISSSP